MKSFAHVDASSIEKAVEALSTPDGGARVIGGGTDLIGQLKSYVLSDALLPRTIVNLKEAGLDYIRDDGDKIRIGATTRLGDVARDVGVNQIYKALAEAAGQAASPALREMATIGGNICQSTRCWYYWNPNNRFDCQRKGGNQCYALIGEARNHSILGGVRVVNTPCTEGCPAKVQIPAYMSLLRDKDIDRAARVLMESNPFPAITGRVCPHTCQDSCNRTDLDQSVSIRNVERVVGDYAMDHLDELLSPEVSGNGGRVAVVGSGPAGLSAAMYLRRHGHDVTILESLAEPGGMLRHMIPAYRLPTDLVERVVDNLKAAGVEIQCGVKVGRDTTLSALRSEFDAVFIGVGAWGQPRLGLENEKLLKSGLDFLKATKDSCSKKAHETPCELIKPGDSVVVIGGGNVAVDVALSAKRLGSKKVTMVCLESEAEMPAFSWERKQAIEEGVDLLPSWGPSVILTENGVLTGLELVRCTAVFDEKGVFRPRFDDAVKEKISADCVFLAIGQRPDLESLDAEGKLRDGGAYIKAAEDTQETTVAGVFAGGDVTTGPASVIKAFAAGRRAAIAISAYLQADKEDSKIPEPNLVPCVFNAAFLSKTAPAEMPKLPVESRAIDAEDELGLGTEGFEREINRCFNCSCISVNNSDIAAALIALNGSVKTTKRTIDAGSFFSVGVGATTVLDDDEIVVEIVIPKPPEGAKSSFVKYALRKTIDFPIVSCAVMAVDGGETRICMNAIYNVPYRALASEQIIMEKKITEHTAEEASRVALSGVVDLPKSGYKVSAAQSLVKKALLSCR